VVDQHQHPHIYCLVPPDRADELLAPLRRHFGDDPALAVLVERRRGPDTPRFLAPVEQRHRRAPVAQRDLAGTLPDRFRDDPDVVRFEQRLQPLGGHHQATTTEDLVAAIRAGDADAASELWWRINERVRMRLRARLGDVEGPRAEGKVLGRILDEVERYEHEPDRAFTTWLDEVVDRFAAERLAA
jgi:hypothetical protein